MALRMREIRQVACPQCTRGLTILSYVVTYSLLYYDVYVRKLVTFLPIESSAVSNWGTTSGSDEIPTKKESDDPPPESNPTATSGLEGSSGADIFFESDQRVRSNSASEVLRVSQQSLKVKSPTPSLENIIEQQEGKSSPQIRVIRNYGTASLSESSDSIYRTPPTTRRIMEKDVPLRNQLATRSVVARPDDTTGSYRSSISSLPREPVQQQDHHQLQALLSKIEEVEQVRMKQHEDLMKMIAEKIDTLVTEIRDSRESERKVSTDGVKPQDGKGEYRDIGESQLPRNIPRLSQSSAEAFRARPSQVEVSGTKAGGRGASDTANQGGQSGRHPGTELPDAATVGAGPGWRVVPGVRRSSETDVWRAAPLRVRQNGRRRGETQFDS